METPTKYVALKEKGLVTLERDKKDSDKVRCTCPRFNPDTGEELDAVTSTLSISQLKEARDWTQAEADRLSQMIKDCEAV